MPIDWSGRPYNQTVFLFPFVQYALLLIILQKHLICCGDKPAQSKRGNARKTIDQFMFMQMTKLNRIISYDLKVWMNMFRALQLLSESLARSRSLSFCSLNFCCFFTLVLLFHYGMLTVSLIRLTEKWSSETFNFFTCCSVTLTRYANLMINWDKYTDLNSGIADIRHQNSWLSLFTVVLRNCENDSVCLCECTANTSTRTIITRVEDAHRKVGTFCRRMSLFVTRDINMALRLWQSEFHLWNIGAMQVQTHTSNTLRE